MAADARTCDKSYIRLQGSVVVQRQQLGAFCDALGAQSRFGFCLVPVPGALPPRPALPKNLRMPMPGNAAPGVNLDNFTWSGKMADRLVVLQNAQAA